MTSRALIRGMRQIAFKPLLAALALFGIVWFAKTDRIAPDSAPVRMATAVDAGEGSTPQAPDPSQTHGVAAEKPRVLRGGDALNGIRPR